MSAFKTAMGRGSNRFTFKKRAQKERKTKYFRASALLLYIWSFDGIFFFFFFVRCVLYNTRAYYNLNFKWFTRQFFCVFSAVKYRVRCNVNKYTLVFLYEMSAGIIDQYLTSCCPAYYNSHFYDNRSGNNRTHHYDCRRRLLFSC